MDIIISHSAALEVARQPYYLRHLATLERCPLGVPERMPSPTEVAEARRLCPQLTRIDGSIGVLVSNHAAHHRSAFARTHIRGQELAPGSLIQLAHGVRCASPALFALQLASKLTHLELAMLLSELLGLYAISNTDELGLAQRSRPILSTAGLTSLIAGSHGTRGAAKLRDALSAAPVLAASPMEAKLYLRATTPPSEGGYGFSTVTLNDPVKVAELSREAATLRTRKPDLLFINDSGARRRRVCLDYMGSQHEPNVRADTARRNELLAAGFIPYEIYKEHYDDLAYMDGLMAQIRNDLGLPAKDQPERKAARLLQRRRDLWHELEAIDMMAWTQREDLR